MRSSRLYFLAIVIIVFLSSMVGCQPVTSVSNSLPQPASTATTSETTAATQPSEDTLDTVLQQLSVREKVGQLFIVHPEALDAVQVDGFSSSVTAFSPEMAQMLKQYPAGGIILFGDNIIDPQQLTTLIDALQSASSLPLFMSADEEGGLVVRLANRAAFGLPEYKSVASVGASGDPADALDMGITIGSYLYNYGFNMDFAPVADVNTNPDNPVIGTRAFSADATVAAQMARAMADGLRQENIIPVFKHFPGHGDTAEDSHNGIAVSYKTKEEMQNCEWLPYESLTDTDCVMVGHIATPNITGDNTPATMSYAITTEILREHLGFHGLIITDSLSMGAIINEYTAGEAAIKAIEAGCDILLCPENYPEAFDAVVAATESGRLSEERLDESVYRILLLKEKYGLLNS